MSQMADSQICIALLYFTHSSYYYTQIHISITHYHHTMNYHTYLHTFLYYSVHNNVAHLLSHNFMAAHIDLIQNLHSSRMGNSAEMNNIYDLYYLILMCHNY